LADALPSATNDSYGYQQEMNPALLIASHVIWTYTEPRMLFVVYN